MEVGTAAVETATDVKEKTTKVSLSGLSGAEVRGNVPRLTLFVLLFLYLSFSAWLGGRKGLEVTQAPRPRRLPELRG